MIAQKYPANSHVMIVEQSSNYGEIRSTAKKTKAHQYGNYNKSPFYVNSGGSECRDGGHAKVDMYDYPSDSHKDEKDDNHFFKSIRGCLILGKLIGVLPFSGIFGRSWKNLAFRKKSMSAAMSYGITAVLILNGVIGLITSIRSRKRNALEIAESIRSTLYSIWGCLIYVKFICHGNSFLKIFQVWSSVHVFYSIRDTTLRRDTFLITCVILASAILENGVLHLEYFRGLDSISGEHYKDAHANMTNLETYYWRAHYQWASVLGYHWFLAIVGFIQHKWILYSWNYMDILLAVFGRALYFRFKSLLHEAEKKLLGPEEMRLNNLTVGICNDRSAWVQVVNDHQNLCRLLDVMESFFSPVVFASYAINMFYICLQLLDGLTNEVTNHSIVHSIYAPWSFLHLIMRALIVSICCARINVYAHRIRDILQECPIEHYTTEISRVDKRVSAGPDIGFTGLGCFIVTKPFILSMLSVIFTFEIVLLQCVPTNTSPTPSPKSC